MKHLLLPFLVLLFLTSCKKDENDPVIPEPNPTYFSFTGEIGINDNSTISSADNNLIICGNLGSNIYIHKISKSGKAIWNKAYYTWIIRSIWSIAETNDQNIFVCGYSLGNDINSNLDVLLIKLNSTGDTLWSRTYGGSLDDLGYNVIPTQDGNLLLSGISYSSSIDARSDIYLIKVNLDGDTLWTKTYVDAGIEVAYHILETQNGEFLVTGTNQDTSSERELYFLKVSADGTPIWNKKIGPAIGKWGYSTIELSNGDLLTCGKITVGDDSQILVVRMDDHGNVLWEKEYGQSYFTEQGNSLRQNADGSFIIAGSTHEKHSGESGIALLKIDQSGNQLLLKEFGGTYSSAGKNILKDENDDNIITGNYNGNIFMTRTDNNGVYK